MTMKLYPTVPEMMIAQTKHASADAPGLCCDFIMQSIAIYWLQLILADHANLTTFKLFKVVTTMQLGKCLILDSVQLLNLLNFSSTYSQGITGRYAQDSCA